MRSTETRELACVPAAIPAAQRLKHFARGRELLDVLATERLELPNGYAIRFGADAFEAVARFVANERKCCPFLTFELRLEPGSGPLWLRMTGPDGTRAVLDAELRGGSAASTTVDRQANCADSVGGASRIIKWAAAGGILAALGVCAACCLLPFALLSVGIAGAWVSGLDAFAPYKWPLLGLVALLLGYGFYEAYVKPMRSCAAGAACKPGGSSRTVRVGLWIATILTIGGLVFEQIEPVLRSH